MGKTKKNTVSGTKKTASASTRPNRGGKSQKSTLKETESFPGITDILPKEGNLWKEVRHAFFATAEIHAFHHIETGLMERKTLFTCYEAEHKRKIDDVAFLSAKGNAVLRPETMIPLLRAYAEHHLGHFSLPLKVSVFSEIVVKRGTRLGENLHELGFHVLGDGESFYDIQVLSAAIDFLRALKIKDISIRVNANGCRNCRVVYRDKLKKHISTRRKELTIRDFKILEKNPEALFSFENKKYAPLIEAAPTILDFLCQNCNNHFKSLLELLEDNDIPYVPDPHLLFPVERWNRAIFAVTASGAKEPLIIGGRYDHLSESAVNRQIPAVGAISSAEAIIRYIREQGIYLRSRERPKVFFIVMGEKATRTSVRLMNMLRGSGIIVEEALGKQSFKAQIKMAEKSRATLVLIVGQKEAFEDTVIVRNIASGAQETITTKNLSEEVKYRFKMS